MTRLSNKEIQTIINDMKWCDECLYQLDQFFNGEIDFDDIDIQFHGVEMVHSQGIKLSLSIIENTIENNLKKLHKCYIMDPNDINDMSELYANLLGKLMYQTAIYCFWSLDSIPEQLLCKFKELIIQQHKYQYGLTEGIFNNDIDVAGLCTVLEMLEDTWPEYYKDGELCSNEEMYKIIERQMICQCADDDEGVVDVDVEF
jgi:hypothetical protein